MMRRTIDLVVSTKRRKGGVLLLKRQTAASSIVGPGEDAGLEKGRRQGKGRLTKKIFR